MKKLITLLMVAVLTLSFSACGMLADVANDVEVAPSGGSETPAIEKTFSLGTVEGSIYTNEFAGIRFTAPAGWTYADEAEIKEMNQATAEMAGEDYEELMKEAQVIYDMFVAEDATMNNVNINFEKVDAAQLAALDIASNYETLFSTIESSFENMGFTGVGYEIKKVTVAGRTLDAMYITADFESIKMHQCSFSIKCNGYLASVSVTSDSEAGLNNILSYFSWVD